MDFRLKGTRRIVDLLAFMLRSLKAERCDFGGKNRLGAGKLSKQVSTLVSLLYRTVNGELKFIQNRSKTAFEAKGRLYSTGKVIQRLFIIGLYTQLAIYGYR